MVVGELPSAWAGYGGGAGGDALSADVFPTVPFGPPNTTDKKGAGGGGAGGQLRIVALGRIVFQDGGRILAQGGDGATGENVLGFDHIAGSSGGGSGGHAILESSEQIDFTDGGTNQIPQLYIQADGGVGGIPKLPELWSGGGLGGGGVVQLHVPDPNPATAVGTDEFAAIRIPLFSTLSDLTVPEGQVLIPNVSDRSKARSIWIPFSATILGAGDDGVDHLPIFEGIVLRNNDPEQGRVQAEGGAVQPLPPVLGPEALGGAAPSPFVDVDGFTLVLSEPSLQPWIQDAGFPSGDIYLRNPQLLRSFELRLESASASEGFDVTAASYDDAARVLRLLVDTAGASLETFVQAAGGPGNVSYALVPRYFRVRTGSESDALPAEAYVKILFQATAAGSDGQPLEEGLVLAWTADAGAFAALANSELDFFRFEVEFDFDADGFGFAPTSEPLSLEFLRLPFQVR